MFVLYHYIAYILITILFYSIQQRVGKKKHALLKIQHRCHLVLNYAWALRNNVLVYDFYIEVSAQTLLHLSRAILITRCCVHFFNIILTQYKGSRKKKYEKKVYLKLYEKKKDDVSRIFNIFFLCTSNIDLIIKFY